MKATSNVWKAAIQASTELKKSVGEIIGRVTCQNRSRACAPSIEAASYSSWGMPCSPARKMTIMLPPMAPHSATAISAGRAQFGSPKQPGPLKPAGDQAATDSLPDLVASAVLGIKEPQPDIGRCHSGGNERHEEDRCKE